VILKFSKMTAAASTGEFNEAANLLAAAFVDTPFHKALAPDRTEREQFVITSFRGRLSRALGYNDIELAFTEQGKIVGLASWIPPVPADSGTAPAPPAQPSVSEEFAHLSRGFQERYAAFLEVLHSELAASVRQPFWELAPLAVLPEAEGKGVGRALVFRKIAESSDTGIPIALSTQDLHNAVIYHRWGFSPIRRVEVLPGIWSTTMVFPRVSEKSTLKAKSVITLIVG